MSTSIPSKIELKPKARCLAIHYANEAPYQLSFEFLRVHSPSAEVRGHGGSNAVLQVGKENVTITRIEPVGNYAIKLIFDDGHDSGLYTWSLLREYCQNQDSLWRDYLEKLKQSGQTHSE